MRLWTLHPRLLDGIALAAVWRRALLAREVLRGRTRAYRNHPQLARFKAHASPVSAINAYLRAIHDEAAARGYRFDARKLGAVRNKARIPATKGQLAHEWRHLKRKLADRGRKPPRGAVAAAHPLFRIVPGPVEDWERGPGAPAGRNR